MATKMKTLTINDVTYDITDDSAVSFVEEQSLTEEQKAQARANIGAQPVGEYLTEVPEGYAKNEDIKKVDRKVDTLREVVSKFHSNIVCDSKGEVITVSDASDMELAGLRIFGKTTQNGTPTPEAPIPLESVGDSGTVSVTACGHNVFDEQMEIGHINAETGESYADSARLRSVNYIPILPATKYYLQLSGAEATIRYYDSDKNYIGYGDSMWHSQNRVVTTPENARFIRVVLGTNYGTVYRNNIAINYPETVTEYEPYVSGGSVTVTPVDSSGNSLYLPGIPVTSGGNYTDSTGQQWICDEVDFARGKYVQRVVKIGVDFFKNVVPSTDSNWYNEESSCSYELKDPQKPLRNNAFTSLCNVLPSYKFAYFYNKGIVEGVMNEQSYLIVNLDKSRGIDMVEKFKAWCNEAGFEVIKFLATPIETDLTAEEIAQYSALHTNYPNTTVFNDAGAHMDLKYVADTKNYIDNKFAELASAIVNN